MSTNIEHDKLIKRLKRPTFNDLDQMVTNFIEKDLADSILTEKLAAKYGKLRNQKLTKFILDNGWELEEYFYERDTIRVAFKEKIDAFLQQERTSGETNVNN